MAADTRWFPVVGIGASAGGLEALTSFFGAVAPDSGMAYVIVMHLDPEHESNIASLLSNASSISIEQATDGVRVVPDHGYIVAPGHNMRFEDGRFDLSRADARDAHSWWTSSSTRSLRSSDPGRRQ
ncbi:MAG: chemotaxis protein CheB [Spirochaetota bacterium]